MRTWTVPFAIVFLFPFFGFAATDGYSVTYPADAERVCPANSTMNGSGTQCFCNSGYRVAGTSCIKDEAMPPGEHEIYEDVMMQVIFNDDLTCAQMGMLAATELDMCKRFQATPADKREQWKKIPRPTTPTSAITNPWAPAGQQILSGGNASSTQALPPFPEPPPSPPAPEATSTTPAPEVIPAPVETEPTADVVSPATALADIAKQTAEKIPEDNSIEEKKVETDPPKDAPAEIDPPQVESQPFAQIASAAESQNALSIASTTSGLVPLSYLVAVPTADQDSAPEATEDAAVNPPSLFGRIAAWFFSIF